MNETLVCCRCGQEVSVEESVEFADKVYCEDCYEECTVTCDCCGVVILSSELYGDDGVNLCSRCYTNCFQVCDQCGRVIPNEEIIYEEDDVYCQSCYDSHSHKHVIRDYDYKPMPIFYGHGNRFFGVELEIDDGGEYNSSAREDEALKLYCKQTNAYQMRCRRAPWRYKKKDYEIWKKDKQNWH